jgi:phenylacetate-CoA ligase
MLRAAVERAHRVPFYVRHLAGARLEQPDDFLRLPLTRKEHLVEASPLGMLAVPPAHAWHYHESSGTTGAPISTWCGLAELGQMASDTVALVPELAAPDAMLLNRFPSFAPIHFVLEEVLRQTSRCHIAAGTMSWDVPFSRALGFLRRLPVTVLATLPLEPVLLREVARSEGVDLARDCASLRVIILAGAVVPAALRRSVEASWRVRVVEIYGSNETMLLGVSCVRGALHLLTDLLEIEILDPQTLAPVPPATAGLLTVTSLVHEVMPLVRYVTGDLVQIDPVPCACGAPTPTGRVLGRAADVIAVGSAHLTPYALLDACYEFIAAIGARVFFVVVLRRGLELLVEAPEPAPGTRVAEERRLAVALGVPVTVQYLEEGDVLDRSALSRSPKIYKPSQVSDWRGGGRKTVTIMEALLEWPTFDLRTIGHIVRRQVRSARRRKRLAASDR